MESLEIKSTNSTFFTPYVKLDAVTGICEISGESYTENTDDFYDRIINWLNQFQKEVKQPIKFDFKLSYLNTSSFKAIFYVLKTLKNIQDSGISTSVNWYYPQDDLDLLAEAEDLAESTELKINTIPYVTNT